MAPSFSPAFLLTFRCFRCCIPSSDENFSCMHFHFRVFSGYLTTLLYLSLGSVRISNKSDRSAIRCRYRNLSWGCAIRIGTTSVSIKRHRTPFVYHEGGSMCLVVFYLSHTCGVFARFLLYAAHRNVSRLITTAFNFAPICLRR